MSGTRIAIIAVLTIIVSAIWSIEPHMTFLRAMLYTIAIEIVGALVGAGLDKLLLNGEAEDICEG